MPASHWRSDECCTRGASSVRCDGRLAAENAALLTAASMPNSNAVVSHCELLERSSSRAEEISAPGGIVTPAKRNPAKLVAATAPLPTQSVEESAVKALPSSLTSSAPDCTWNVFVVTRVPESSLTMVPTPWVSPKTPLTGAVRLTANVSLGSAAVSPVTGTTIGSEVTPGLKVSVPLPAVKSVGAVAVPFAVAYCTDTLLPLACDSDTVKLAGVVPALPSVTDASAMAMVGGASSLLIVTMPVPSSIVALPGLDSVTEKVCWPRAPRRRR